MTILCDPLCISATTFEYTERDAALYALSVGACDDPLDEKDLPLVYEMAGDGFRALPTMVSLYAIESLSQIMGVRALSWRLVLCGAVDVWADVVCDRRCLD